VKLKVLFCGIKRLIALTTDFQMYALKTLRIPLQGKHSPSAAAHISLVLSACGGHPFHPSVSSFIPSSIHPSSSSRKKKMMEEEEQEWRQQQFIQMFM
jgi:hypothetical protein